MSRSGKTMDSFTKGIQGAEGRDSTISYRETGSGGYEAKVTSGGGEYVSRSFDTKDEARQEAADMATDDQGFLYQDDSDDDDDDDES